MKRNKFTGRYDAVDSMRGESVKTNLVAPAIGFAGLLPAASAHARGSLAGARAARRERAWRGLHLYEYSAKKR